MYCNPFQALFIFSKVLRFDNWEPLQSNFSVFWQFYIPDILKCRTVFRKQDMGTRWSVLIGVTIHSPSQWTKMGNIIYSYMYYYITFIFIFTSTPIYGKRWDHTDNCNCSSISNIVQKEKKERREGKRQGEGSHYFNWI